MAVFKSAVSTGAVTLATIAYATVQTLTRVPTTFTLNRCNSTWR